MDKDTRLDWIDISKGIGILLVVFAHTLVPALRDGSIAVGFIWIFIYNFHMPLFFFISGWLFEKGLSRHKDKGKFILGKLKLLMLPYLTFSVFAYAFIRAALNIDKLAAVLSGGGYSAAGFFDAFCQIITYNNHTDQHLWFVFSLFLVFLINTLLPKLMKSKPMLFILLALYVSKAFVHYYGILNYTAGDLIFFSLARVLYSKDKSFSVSSPPGAVRLISVFVLTNCVFSYFYVTGMPQGFTKAMLYIIRCVSSVSGIMCVCSAANLLQNKKAAKPLIEAGQYSYDIYLMHAPFLVSGLMGILLSYSFLPAPVCCIMVFLAGILLPYLLSRFIIRKIPLLSLIILGKSGGKKAAAKNSINI